MVVFLTVVHGQYNEGPTYIVHPTGQNVELLYGNCVRERTANESAAWMIDQRGPYTVQSIANGLVDGYSADIYNYNLIIKNIAKNDDRNGTEYRCAISTETPDTHPGYVLAIEKGNVTTLCVAGEYVIAYFMLYSACVAGCVHFTTVTNTI